jgi:hypothetical protein
VVGAFREKGVGWIRIVWPCRVHSFDLSNVRYARGGRLGCCGRGD